MLRTFIIVFVLLVIVYFAYHALYAKNKVDRKMYRILKRRYLASMEKENILMITAAGKEFADSHVAKTDDLENLYKDSLRLARDNPELKLYAMEIGRRKYGSKHEDGEPTMYDETAIQNDIEAVIK